MQTAEADIKRRIPAAPVHQARKPKPVAPRRLYREDEEQIRFRAREAQDRKRIEAQKRRAKAASDRRLQWEARVRQEQIEAAQRQREILEMYTAKDSSEQEAEREIAVRAELQALRSMGAESLAARSPSTTLGTFRDLDDGEVAREIQALLDLRTQAEMSSFSWIVDHPPSWMKTHVRPVQSVRQDSKQT
jgi:hypothetical protein